MKQRGDNNVGTLELRWVDGKYHDNWVNVVSQLEVEGAAEVMINAFLPADDSGTNQKTVQVLISGRKEAEFSVRRCELTTIVFKVQAQGPCKVTLICSAAELTSSDARSLGFSVEKISLRKLQVEQHSPAKPLALPSESVSQVLSEKVSDEKKKEASIPYSIFPDYRSTNPYQKLIEEKLPSVYSISYIDIIQAIKKGLERVEMGQKPGVFHLHWTSPVTGAARSEAHHKALTSDFLYNIDLFHSIGGIVIWTIHNIIPHDSEYYEAECAFMSSLASRADILHIHSMRSLTEIEAHFPIPRSRLVEIPHPSYHGVYPNYVDREGARRALGLDPDVFSFLFIGQLRPYKGIDALISSVSTLRASGHPVQVLIAGKAVYPYTPETVRKMIARLDSAHVITEFISDDELQLYYAAADVAVFPYRSVLTSGSVICALSFGVPVIAPRVGAITDVAIEGKTGWTYSAEPGALLAVMERALESKEQLPEMRKMCIDLTKAHTWESFAEKLHASISECMLEKEIQVETLSGEHSVSVIAEAMLPTNVATVGIVVVSYGGVEDLRRQFSSLETISGTSFELYLIDNCSPNVSRQKLRVLTDEFRFPISIYRTKENLGYAAGNNIGINLCRQRGHDFIWLLNPDVEVTPNSLQVQIDLARENECAKVIGSVILRNRHSQKIWSAGGRIRFEGGIDASHLFSGMDVSVVPTAPYVVDYVTGASLFVCREVFDSVGLLPEDYFLYFEETDWCLRVRKKLGDVLLICPQSKLYHDKTSEKGDLPAPYYFYYYIRNAILFTVKHAPAYVQHTVRGVSDRFISPWLSKIKVRDPSAFDRYRRIADVAVNDGLSGIVGRRINFSESRGLNKEGGAKAGILSVSAGILIGWVECGQSESNPTEVCLLINDSKAVQLNAKIIDEATALGRQEATRHQYDRSELDGVIDLQATTQMQKPRDYTNTRTYFTAGVPIEIGVGEVCELRIVTADEALSQPFRYLNIRETRYSGRIDGCSGYEIRGWACNLGRPDSEIEVQIAIEGTVVVSGVANQYRKDLKAAQIGNGYHGFALRLPLRFLDGKKRRFSLVLVATGEVIHERDIECSSPLPKFKAGSLMDQEQWLYLNRELRYDETDSLVRFYLDARNISKSCRLKRFPKVSVIMPVFNREATVVSALESAMAQTHSNLEVLVVDDGSRDNSSEIISDFIERNKERRIRLIRLEKNFGVSFARNIGLGMAKGEYVAYLDSDNFWQPEYLDVMLCHLKASGAKTAYCAQRVFHVVCGAEGRVLEPVSIRGGEFDLSQIENRNFIDLNCFVHGIDLVQGIGGFNERMKRLVDWEFIVRYCRRERPVYVPALLSDYYMGRADNQITRVEPHAENLSLLNLSLEKDSSDRLKDDRYRKKVLLIVPVVGGEDLNAIAERIIAVGEVGKTALFAIGEAGASTINWLRVKDDLLYTAECVSDWGEFCFAASGLVDSCESELPFVCFALGRAFLFGDTILSLASTLDALPSAKVAAAVDLVRVTEKTKLRNPFAQGPNLFPVEVRPFRARSLGNGHVYISDKIRGSCLVSRSDFLSFILCQMCSVKSWEDFCDTLHEVSNKGSGFSVVDQTARVILR